MTRNTNILNELNEISPVVASIGTTNTYQIPQDYFENFADNMLSKAKALTVENVASDEAILSPLLNELKNRNPFTLPEGYFSDLPENVTAGAKAIEFVNEALENLSPVMNGLKGSNVYTAPEDYFEFFPDKILLKAKEQSPVKVVPISFGKKFIRYAVAAVITGAISISGWWYVQHKTSDIKSIDVAAKVEQDIKALKDDEIEQYINNSQTNYSSVAVAANSNELSNENIKDMIADIPDDELQQYLDEHGNIKESLN